MQKSGDVDPMIPGTKIMGIFGFCDIRQFTDTTEILQEGIMLFVNEIADIVHGVVDQYSGTANKNIGDAFLMAWKFDNKTDTETGPDGEIRLKKTLQVSQICDMSLVSFLKIDGQIKRSRKLTRYQKNTELNRRMPNYSVKFGYGLHVGWAVEGAIGSYFKIDASYLSPHVNMSARLEGGTKLYGIPYLISGPLYEHMTSEIKVQMR